jgi:hypothetical protein
MIYLRICGSFMSAKNKWGPPIAKYMVRKSQIRKMPHLRNVRKSKKLIRKFAVLRFAELCIFVNHV